MLSNEAFADALRNDELPQPAARPGYAAALAGAAMQRALRDTGFDAALAADRFAACAGARRSRPVTVLQTFLQLWRHSWGCLHSFSPKIAALMRFRCGLLVAFLCAFPLAAAAQLTEEQSPGLRVIYLDVHRGLPRPARHAHRAQLARVSEEALRLRSRRRRHGAAAGLERLRQRRRLVRARTTWSASRSRRSGSRSRRSPPTSA